MRRILVAILALIFTAGAASLATGQEATPTPLACESPTAATPAATPEPAVVPSASPVPCGLSSVVEIELLDIAFRPTEITIAANAPVTIELHNNGLAPHNFTIDALGISVDLAAGESQTIQLTAPAGDHEFYCDVPGHLQAGMKGVLHAV